MIAQGTFFRALIPEIDGLPEVGRSARQLGVRIPIDIFPDEEGNVSGGKGGMSVAPTTMWNIPTHRRPRGMGRGSTGKASDRVYVVTDASFDPNVLAIRSDPNAPEIHAMVEPAVQMDLGAFESGLASTRSRWKQAWP
jgi:hypothetical protein